MSKTRRTKIRDKLQISLSHLDKAGAYLNEVDTMFDDELYLNASGLPEETKKQYEQHKIELTQMMTGIAMWYEVLEKYWRMF